MDNQQFVQFMNMFQQMVQGQTALATAIHGQQPTQNVAQQNAQQGGNIPKISVRIPTYKGEPTENALAWLLQVEGIFKAQGIKDEQTRLNYAVIGFEGGALHWYLNKVQIAKDAGHANVFADWATFTNVLKESFQPPNYQHYFRQ
jgi:hypothetical protein